MKKIILILLMFLLSIPCSFASKLPDDLWNYIKKSFPNSTQRFDSVVVITPNIMYVPLYPAQVEEVNKIEIEYTYPASKKLTALPDVVIFNNNFVLLKISKDKNGNFRIIDNPDLPLKVKLGVMPQDMLIPPNLKVPESLRLVLGDLVIPSLGDDFIVNQDGSSKKIQGQVYSDDFSLSKDTFFPLSELKGKMAYVTSSGSKFVNVFDETSSKPLYELKLSALPSELKASDKTKYAIALYYQNKTIDILDLYNERILTQLNLETLPKDMIIEQDKNIAYISSPSANTIYVVDIKEGHTTQAIKLMQSPSKITMHTDGKSIAFIDGTTQDLYVLELTDNYSTRHIGATKNISSLIYDDDYIYAISRTRNNLIVYNRYDGSIYNDIKLHNKPTDALLYNGKIFIVCAGFGGIDVYDIAQKRIVKTIELQKKGFYSKITPVLNEKNAIITGFNTGKFAVIDFDEMKVVKEQDFNIQVTNFVIINK